MAEGHSATVKLDGDSSNLERAFSRSAQKAREFDSAVTRTEATSKRANAAIAATTTVADRHSAASGRMEKATSRVGFALHQVVGQTASVNQALQGVLGTFGGWGVAIGALVGVVLHFAEAQDTARKEAIKLNDELRKQAGLRREKQAEEESDALIKRQSARETKRLEALRKEREQVAINAEEEKRGLEEAITIAESRGQKAEGFLRRQAELQAEVLEQQSKFAEGEEQIVILRERDAVLHEEKLRRLEVEGRHEKDLTDHKKKQLTLAEQLAKINAEAMKRTPFGSSPSFGRTGEDTLFDIEAGGQRAANGMPGLSVSGAPAILRNPNAARDSERAMNERLRAVETERATAGGGLFGLGGSQAELDRIEEEKQAQLDHITLLEQVSGTETMVEERRAVAHEAEMARIQEETSARQKYVAMATQATQQLVAGVLSITDARRAARNAALAQGKTEAEAAKAAKIAGREALAAQLTTLRNLAIVKVIEQTAEGIGALASFNYPGAALHFAAAATWGVVAGAAGGAANRISDNVTSMQRADSLKEAKSKGGGSGAGGGGSSSPSLPPGSNSPIPGSPGPSAPSAGGGSSSGAGNKTIVFTGPVHLYGTPHREFIRTIDEGLEDLSHNRRRRSA